MTYQNIRLQQPEPGIRVLTIDRAPVLNALNADTLEELDAAIAEVAGDAAARVMLLTGAGDKAFVAGADISEMVSLTALQARRLSERAASVLQRLEGLPIPVIAVVNGYALGGGCELAMSCDWIIASEQAIFGQPEVKLGVPPGFGGTQRLLRRVGTAMALELMTSGRQVKAEEAREIGLVNHVYAQQELMERAMEMARTIATRAPLAVALVKQAVQRGQDLDLGNACALETQSFALSFCSRDRVEGMQAFLDRREPKFSGE